MAMSVLSKAGCLALALAGLAACNDSASPSDAPEATEESMRPIESSPGDVVLSCVYEQDGSGYIELVATEGGGYESATVTIEYDPWDCRCEYEKRTVFGTYDICNVSVNDNRVLSCFNLANPTTVGNFIFTSSKVTTTQIAIGSPLEVSRDELALAVINTQGNPPRKDFVYGLHECQGF